MLPDVHATWLDASSLDEAAALQARAFFNDPLAEFVLPAEAARRECLPSLIRVLLAYGFEVAEERRIQPRGPVVWMLIRHGRHRPHSHLERKAPASAPGGDGYTR